MRKKIPTSQPIASPETTFIIEQRIKELTLLLLFLTSREVKGLKGRASWKNFNYRVLDQLRKDDCIDGAFHEPSVFLTDKGMAEALRLKQKYYISRFFS